MPLDACARWTHWPHRSRLSWGLWSLRAEAASCMDREGPLCLSLHVVFFYFPLYLV